MEESGVVLSQSGMVIAQEVEETGGTTCVWRGEKRWEQKAGHKTGPIFIM